MPTPTEIHLDMLAPLFSGTVIPKRLPRKSLIVIAAIEFTADATVLLQMTFYALF